jgi:hypothetical protein
MPADDVDDVGSGNDFLNEGIGDLAAGAHGVESSGGACLKAQAG